MVNLLIFKERLKTFYGKYDVYLIALWKFILSYVTFFMLNRSIGSMAMLKNPFVGLLLALLCSLMPYGVIVSVAAIFMLLHLSSISMELALVTGILLILVGILYYGQQPGDSILLLLTPLLFAFKIPYAIPLIGGLALGLSSVIPIASGVCIYYILLYVKENMGVLTNGAQTELLQKYSQAIDSVLTNPHMLLMAAAFALAFLFVNVLRRMSINYAWILAIAVGTIALAAVLFLGSMQMNLRLDTLDLVLGMFVSLLLAAGYHFFVFAVDYSRIEHVQYEDDEYYYYVKAVPKIMVTEPDVRIQKISGARRQSRNIRERD
ncbi:MAG: ABC transporter permease [bacterium]|nr:ABC transporter permease [bacterium]